MKISVGKSARAREQQVLSERVVLGSNGILLFLFFSRIRYASRKAGSGCARHGR